MIHRNKTNDDDVDRKDSSGGGERGRTHAADSSGLGDQWQCSTESSDGRGDGRSALRTDEGEPYN